MGPTMKEGLQIYCSIIHQHNLRCDICYRNMTIPEQQLVIKDTNRHLEVKVLCLNIWGIPFLSKDRHERVQAIAEHLVAQEDSYHYVFLQEVWSKSDFEIIAKKVSKNLPYSHYFYCGVLGSGLCILSCTPIRETHFHRWTLNGYPHKIFHADWYGGKGLALCRTQFKGIPILLANTHLHAQYDSSDEYLHHRVVEAFEASQLLRLTSQNNHLVIFGGDFNSDPSEVPYRVLLYNSGFSDSYSNCVNKSPDELGATNESPCNSYTCPKILSQNPNGKRIDYVLYSVNPFYQVKIGHDQPLPPRVPQKNFSFSDHEAIRTVFTLKPKSNQDRENTREEPCFGRTHALLDAAAVCSQGMRLANKAHKSYSYLVIFITLLQVTLSMLYFAELSAAWQYLLAVALMLMTAASVFFFVLLIFSVQERSCLTATRLAIERLLDEMTQKNALHFDQLKKQECLGNGGSPSLRFK